MKKNALGIFFIVVMIFGFLFGISFSNGFNLGDRILTGIGLKTWSNGMSGLHYTAIYSLILIILAWTGVNVTLGKKYPKITSIFSFLLLLLLLVPIILRSLGINI